MYVGSEKSLQRQPERTDYCEYVLCTTMIAIRSHSASKRHFGIFNRSLMVKIKDQNILWDDRRGG